MVRAQHSKFKKDDLMSESGWKRSRNEESVKLK